MTGGRRLASETPYNRASFKAAHNSVGKSRPVTRQLAWSAEAPHRFGCRGLELDLVQAADSWDWAVKHGGHYTSDPNRQFSRLLGEIREWSADNPGHDVVTVHLDLKNVPVKDRSFPVQLDEHIRTHFPAEKIFAPGDLMREGKDLVRSAMESGWPTLGDLEGCFVFCLSGSETGKALYADTEPSARLCFADVQVASSRNPWTPSTGEGNRVFFNVWANPMEDDTWPGTLSWYAAKRGFITRVFVVNHPPRWRRALRSGANVLATDRLTDAEWATVGSAPFAAFSVAGSDS